MRPLILLLIALVPATWARATHLIGGELYYTSVGNGQYEVTLKMYRDCGPNNTNGTGFDATAIIAAYRLDNNAFVTSVSVPLSGTTDVPIALNNPCLTPPGTICVEEGLYVATMTLPGGLGGYTLAYQRCCRSPAVINLDAPETQGLTCTVTIPDTDVSGENSSPRFSAYPSIALCADQPMAFAHDATDPDGDELVYDLCAPFIGGDQFNPLPNPPDPPAYSTVDWAFGYSAANMIDAAPPLTIDPSTGFVTLTPTLIGSFCVGVRVKEFRNGVQLSEVIRDFRFDVVPCVQTVVSSIADQDAATLCTGLSMDFENNSTNADDYHWDFGVPGTDADTSDAEEPSFTFPEAGTYTVMLVANPGWPCADTSLNTFTLSPPVSVQFAPPPITCIDEQPLTLTATGQFTPAANVAWALGDGSAPDADQHVTHPTFPDPGTFAVTVSVEENGCTATYTDSVTLHPRPVVDFTVDPAGCIPHDAQFTNLSSGWTPLTYAWDFGDGSTSTDVAPLHTYMDAGFFDVRLTATSSTGCIATVSLQQDTVVQAWPQPIAAFAVDPPTATVMAPTVAIQDLSQSAYHLDFTVNGQHFDTSFFSYTFPDAGFYSVDLIATSGFGCADTASANVFVSGYLFHAPNAFTPDGDGVNELWRPVVYGARRYRLEVFDRWGRTVFSTEDPAEGWDGKDHPVGIYAFKAWLTEWGAAEQEYNGSITLVR